MASEQANTAPSCNFCKRGPTGIIGHDKLFSHTMTSDRMTFKCRECGSMWSRRYGDDGKFLWSPAAGGDVGMDTPGRPGTAPP